MQARAVSVHQILVGYYRIPSSGDQPLEVVVNPPGLQTRSEVRYFRAGPKPSMDDACMLSLRKVHGRCPVSIACDTLHISLLHGAERAG